MDHNRFVLILSIIFIIFATFLPFFAILVEGGDLPSHANDGKLVDHQSDGERRIERVRRHSWACDMLLKWCKCHWATCSIEHPGYTGDEACCAPNYELFCCGPAGTPELHRLYYSAADSHKGNWAVQLIIAFVWVANLLFVLHLFCGFADA
ncbi:hypothetical protein niasHS_001913 [Heterodera schachtii]|uniref:Uncharacterized protein n=1 Tax=Heterodera schachtii TaxID=97005 RepID=A0ABD2KAZ2_HETSC